MASQESQSSQDIKDKNDQEPGSKAAKPKTLGDEWKDQSDADFKKLYDTKFVPWMKKNTQHYPAGELNFPESEFGYISGFTYSAEFMQAFKWMAHGDKLTIVNRWCAESSQGDDPVFYTVKRNV